MSDPSRRLYILGRRDLSASQRAVQACHALANLLLRFADDPTVREWASVHRTLVLLGVDDERALLDWKLALEALGVPCAPFEEPDLDGAVTALAVHPAVDGRLFRRLSLL